MRNNTQEQEITSLEQLKELLLGELNLGEPTLDCPCPICHIKRMVADGKLEKKLAITYLREMMGMDDFLMNLDHGYDEVKPKMTQLADFLSEQGFERDAKVLRRGGV